VERKTKVALGAGNQTTTFVIYTCCAIKQYADHEQLKTLQELKCSACKEPFLMKGSNDVWYYVGSKVF
jgi:hypothetical protein